MFINHHLQCYLLPGPGSGQRLGFDEAFAHTEQMAKLMKRTDLMPTAEARGTLEGYEQYHRAFLRFTNHHASAGTYFDPGTKKEVAEALEQARLGRMKVRLFYGDPATGQDECIGKDVVGKISRTKGTFKRLVLADIDEVTSVSIRTAQVVRIMDVASKLDLYRHPKYEPPTLWTLPSNNASGTVGVYHKRREIDQFASSTAAERWIGFLRGDTPELIHGGFNRSVQ